MKTQLTFEQIKFLVDNNRDVSIQSPTNYSKIKSTFSKELDGYNITFADGTSIKCAKTHNMLCNGNWKTSDELIVGDYLTDKYGNPSKLITQIIKVPSQEWIDFEIDNEFECYVQNDVLHHNSGKSFIIYLIMRFMLSKNKNSIIVVPSVGLVTQMAQDFKDYGWNDVQDYLKQIGGEFKGTKDLSEKPVVLSTWQSLQYMQKEEFNIFDCIVVDECLDEESDILMADGNVKKIKDIIPGDMVKTLNEKTNKIEIKPVEKLHINIPSGDMYEIEMETGEKLKITGNHKVFTSTGWKRTDELTTDDKIISIY